MAWYFLHIHGIFIILVLKEKMIQDLVNEGAFGLMNLPALKGGIL
jgi:hypothetical protein